MNISIGISAHHIHLTKETLEKLFGKGYSLHKLKALTQPTQFACEEVLTLKTTKGEIPNVRVIGPVRTYNQIEISKTDAYKLGLCPPIRNSGEIDGSASIILVGPKGSVQLEEGCIIATRHIHIKEEDIQKYDLNVEKVKVKLMGEKGGILENVYIKPSKEAFFEMHLDTDDGNAHLVKQGDIAEIIRDEKCQNFQK